MKKTSKQFCEYLRAQAKNKFNSVRATWYDQLRWAAPHRGRWLMATMPGERKNQHIVDATHILALRSTVAGYLEGNTSATRPWYRFSSRDTDRNEFPAHKAWLQHYTQRSLSYLMTSNFYLAAGSFYYDFNVVDTGAHYIETLPNARFHFHTLLPGSYYVLNDSLGQANVMVREFELNVKSVVDKYGRKDKNGKADWSNISHNVKQMYQQGNYSTMVAIVHVIYENPEYNPENPDDPNNRQWLELEYEMGGNSAQIHVEAQEFGTNFDGRDGDIFLRRFTTRRKPFIVGRSTEGFEYGEAGPTRDALGLIKSLNKKAISKDRAIEKILDPTLQGPASVRKNYISNAPNTFVPIDSRAAALKQKLEPVYQVNPGIGALLQDTDDMRQQVEKFYYADFLLYLTRNPKTRTAAETNAVLEEQQRVIGPSLQMLNFTYNNPVLEWLMDFVLYEDPFLEPPPEGLQGESLRAEYVSVFAQAQRAADLPQIERYIMMMGNAAQLNPSVLDKVNLDKLADLYEDRLYLPTGLNNPQNEVDAKRQQAAMAAQRQQMMQETIPAMAGAAKDLSGAAPRE